MLHHLVAILVLEENKNREIGVEMQGKKGERDGGEQKGERGENRKMRDGRTERREMGEQK
jgi:hypothetical protein